jgi:hypothetical protein
MLVDNINLIKTRYPLIWNELLANRDRYNSEDNRLEVEQSKFGVPTLTTHVGGKKIYFHSKYNPVEEAGLFIDKYEDIEDYEHLFFYGVGLGYHIEMLANKYPDKMFTIYEPNPSVMYKFLEHRHLSALNVGKLSSIYIEWHSGETSALLQQFVSNCNVKTKLIINSSYERLYPDQIKYFNDRFAEVIYNQRSNLGVNARFERSWTINSMLNFTKILETQNIVSDKGSFFKDKPAILVAAGPSLEDELENLRYIKENGLAYIFSVGSANKALLKNGIHPDAVTSYDPFTGIDGLDVFSDITEQGISTIPLIFGSSVGYQAVNKYTGTLLHMFINQDTVSPYYLGQNQINNSGSMLADAPSVAVITLQLLAKLGCNPIILVGQNFAYRNNQHYASGIEYSSRPNQLTEKEKQGWITLEGAEGGQVYSNKSFEQAKNIMSLYIKNCPHTEVLNATSGGAHIEGTKFQSLNEILNVRLKSRVTVAVMEKEYKEIGGIIDKMVMHFKGMERSIKAGEAKKIEQQLVEFDKGFNRFKGNKFYTVFLQPMVRNQHSILLMAVSDIRKTSEQTFRARKVVDAFGKFIYECQKEMKLIHFEFAKLQQSLLKGSIEENKSNSV